MSITKQNGRYILNPIGRLSGVVPAINKDEIVILQQLDSEIDKVLKGERIFNSFLIRSTGPDGHLWRITIDDTGMFNSEDIGI